MSDPVDAQSLEYHNQGVTHNMICSLLHVGPNRVSRVLSIFRDHHKLPPKCWKRTINMRFWLVIVLLTRTGSSASAGSRIVPSFMLKETDVSSPVIRSRKWHLSCACRTSRSCQAPSNRFALKSLSSKCGTHLKCRLFLLMGVI
jgi:hypothetical protein